MPPVLLSSLPTRRVGALSLLAVAALALSACASGTVASPASPGTLPSSVARVAASVVPDPAPVTPSLQFIGPTGDVVTLPAVPTRIVCITGACDDMLFSLGLTPVGTSTPALLSLPEYLGDAASTITTIPGSFGSEDVEAIAALHPDLVIGLGGVHESMADALAPFAPLWTLKVDSYEDSVANLRTLAALVDRPDQEVQVERDFRQTLADAKATSAANGLDQTVALTMYWSGSGSGVNTSDDLLGGLTAEVFDYPWPNKGGDWSTAQAYSTEEILAKDPAIIFIQSFTTDGGPDLSTQLQDDPVWQRIAAVKNGKVVEVLPALWSSGRGPHALSLVLNEMIDAVTR